MMERLTNTLQMYATECGADFLGIADILPVRDALSCNWPFPLKDLSYGISIGMALNH